MAHLKFANARRRSSLNSFSKSSQWQPADLEEPAHLPQAPEIADYS